MTQNKTIAILGAGKLGVVLAQLAIKAGYQVYIAGSGSPDKIRLSMRILAPGSIVATAAEAAGAANTVILALPLGKYTTIPTEALAGKLVIDAMNYWWEVDGDRPDLQSPDTTTSELVQAYVPDARVVKALSHMGYHHLIDGARLTGTPGRKAIAIAGGSSDDILDVSQLIDDLGFDPLVIGDLVSGKHLEPGHPAFGANVDRTALAALIHA